MILISLSEGIFEKIKKLLEENNLKYEKVETGEELLELAKKSKPELIILEKDLPLLDGFVVSLLLKSHPKTKDVPILTICKCNYPEEKIKAKESGADWLLLYPFGPEEFLWAIKELIRK